MTNMIDAAWAFRRYQQIRHRLPVAEFSNVPEACAKLADIADAFDVFVFDSFGVLNVGDTAIPGAAESVAALRRAGKRVFVLTNAASLPATGGEDKYSDLGFDFKADEIVMSRVLLISALAAQDRAMRWAVVAPDTTDLGDLAAAVSRFDEAGLPNVDGFVLLSSSGWTDDRQGLLERALVELPRPVLVGNPDLVAPREDGFTLQAGAYAHALADATGIAPVFFGKPYANAFDEVLWRIGPDVDRRRILMLGDTLHTDILGAAAAGMTTALVTGHGVLRGLDVDACIAESGIRPDYVLREI